MGECCSSNSNKQITEKQITDKDKLAERQHAKVVIVGAGPAGIHMCSLLVKAGWNVNNITILEKTNRTCGKSMSISDNQTFDSYRPVHELGTCYLHPEYHVIENLFKEYDNDNIRKGIPTRGVFGTTLNDNVVHKSKQEAVDFTKWALAESEKLSVPKEFHWINDAITGGISFYAAVARYNKIHMSIFGKQERNHFHGFLNKPKQSDMEKINCSFLQFLENNKCEALIPFFVYAQSVQGYGTLDAIPAYYGLFWNTPELMDAVSDIFRLVTNEPNVIVVSKGFEHLWKQMIKKHKMNIITNCNIKSVNRFLNDKDKKTKICYVIKEDEQDEKHDENEIEIECDYLFLACGCKKALSFLTDATDEEIEVFSALSPYTFTSTLYEADTSVDDLHETVVEIWPNLIWKANGHLYAHRNSLKCLLGHNKYDKLVKQGEITKDRSVAYQFMARSPDKDKNKDSLMFRDTLKKDLEIWGEKNVNIIKQTVWDYFPIWNQEAINKGYPWKVKNEMQGKNKKTFYIGSSVCFESVLGVVEYNHELDWKFKF